MGFWTLAEPLAANSSGAILFDDFELVRFVEAVAIGEMADQRFEEECRRRGLPAWHGCMAPTEYLALPSDVGTAASRPQ